MYEIMKSLRVFISETAWHIFTRFHMGRSVEEMLKICSNGSAPFNKLLPCPYVIKTLRSILLQYYENFEAESWYTASGIQGLPSLLKWWDPDDLWPFYGMVKFVSQLLWQYWKNASWHLQICNSYFYQLSELWSKGLLLCLYLDSH